ncbi:MAG: ABC transporter ATP-binding protein [Verrucomicrobia bacterium]|nr:ABC transporter ATP-binding protein [Verrucomicrobiota bacterium]
MKKFLPYYPMLKPVLGTFFIALLCGAISGIASGFGLPLMLKKVLPVLFGGGEPQDLVLLDFDSSQANFGGVSAEWLPDLHIVVPADYLLIFALVLMPLVFVIRGAAMFGNTYLLNLCGIRVLEAIRMKLFTHLQHLHLGFFGKNKSGDLLSRTTGDTMLVKTVLVEVTNDLVIQPFTLIGAVGFIVWSAFQSTATQQFLLSLCVVPITVLPVQMIGKRLVKRSKKMLVSAGELSSVLAESLQAPREIRAYNLEDRECSRFRKCVRDFFTLQMKCVKYDKMLTPLIEIIAAASISFAVYQAAAADLDQDTVIALVGALYFAYDPIKKLGKINNRVKEGTAGLARLEEIWQAPIEVADPASPHPLGIVRGELNFKDVTFGYDDVPVLRGVSFTAKPGETIALVGPSGAGKSSLVNLIPRFYDVSIGSVAVDGIDVRDVRLADLRKNIAIVSQDPILFNDTIYNNILIGRLDATREEVIEAAKRASALEFIESLDNGWETVVGERGGRLSGGQRQRIAVARAFLRNAPILILDEATSALDTESEAQIQESLEELLHGRTTFMIAHRFSSIRTAKRILVFDAGRIIADGPHEEIYETCPLYRGLYDQQAMEKVR